MGEPLSLKLSFSFCSSPIFLLKLTYVLVGSLRNEGTGANGPVAPIRGLVLSMTFEQDDGMASIELGEGKVFNVRKDCIDKELEMVDSRIAVILEGKGTNAVEFSNG